MKIRPLNLTLCLVLLLALFGLSAVPDASAQSSPEAVIKAFYNGYIRSTGKGVDPFGKRSTLKKHLTARLIKEQITAHEANQDADYFLRSKEYHAEWENNFNISEPVVKGATATTFVTFPDDHSRVKVTLRKAAGVWKIDDVQNAKLTGGGEISHPENADLLMKTAVIGSPFVQIIGSIDEKFSKI